MKCTYSKVNGSEELGMLYSALGTYMNRNCKKPRRDKGGQSPCKSCVRKARKIINTFKVINNG